MLIVNNPDIVTMNIQRNDVMIRSEHYDGDDYRLCSTLDCQIDGRGAK